MMNSFSNSSSHYAVGYGDQTSGASSSFNPPLRQNHEVFLSFSGEDTRYGFCDHLYHRLVDSGISVFRDREGLIVGQDIDQLLEVIKTSKILVPIISLHYASSKWCLMELVQILKCNKPPAQLVLPIFYKVKPSDVREQKREFGDEFQRFKTQDGVDSTLVKDSEQALKEVASLTIWESDKIKDGYEAELVKIVVTRIFNELRNPVLVVPDYLVGVEKHVERIEEKIDAKQSNGAKFIVIHGMGGIGKTTLAKALYNELSHHYESCSFVPNIREASSYYRGMENLQKQVISDILVDKSIQEIRHVDEEINFIERSFKEKRILLLLDDVGNKDQVNKLAGKNNWFESNSIIIITTRNKEVAVASVHNLGYELTELSNDQSYELFNKHAFGRDASCLSDLKFIAKDIVHTTGGLPLALEVIGSLLHGKSKGFWEDTKEQLRNKLDDTVGERLRISYDVLTYEQQQLFLDIACLPINDKLQWAIYMWESCGLYPKKEIEILKSLSLIKNDGDTNKLVMHDQLRDLGRKIVREEGRRNIRNYSRIWEQEEAMEIMEQEQGTPNVEALILCPPPPRGDNPNSVVPYTSKQFEGMTNLRFLQMGAVYLSGDFENRFLNLKWLQWSRFFNMVEYFMISDNPKKMVDFMGINLNPKKLVILDLYAVNITEHWNSWSQMKYLKVIKLWFCKSLTTTPEFSALKMLEVLILVDCSNLTKIHSSIGKLSKTLKVLNVYNCRKLEELPVEVGQLEELRKLVLDYTRITEVPISEGYMTNLEILSAKACRRLRYIPDSLSSLLKLLHLNLSTCVSLMMIPQSIGKLKLLTELDLSKTGVKELPASIRALTKLKKLPLEGCKRLMSLPIVPPSLVELKLEGCQTLYAFPDLPNMRNLSEITLTDCFELMEISGLEGAESLVELRIESCRKLSRISDLSHLKMLTKLWLRDCGKLSYVEGIEKLTSLIHLDNSGCNLTVKFPELSLNRNCEDLLIHDQELEEIPGLQEMKSLCYLEISRWNSLKYLPDLTHLTNLIRIRVCHCEKLTEIRGLENLKSQCSVYITGCNALEE